MATTNLSERAMQLAKLLNDRTARARLRKPFPQTSPDPTSIDTSSLVRWMKECTFQQLAWSGWRLDGIRWRRAQRRAHGEFTARLLADAGSPQAPCDQCHVRQPTHHVAYQSDDDPNFAHYCEACGPHMPTGWLVVTQA